MLGILGETGSQHGVLELHVVDHEVLVEMDSSYQQTTVDFPHWGWGAICLLPRYLPQVNSLNLQSHWATKSRKISVEPIPLWVGPANCVANVVDTPTS